MYPEKYMYKKRWVCIQKGRGTSPKQHLSVLTSFPFAGLWPCNPAVLGGGVEAATDNSKAEKAVCPGRAEEQQVLGEEVQEQRGSQEVPRGSSPEGKPDRHESAVPRGGEHRAQGGGGALEKGKFRLETDDDGPWGQAQFHGGKSLICCRVNLKCNVITTDVRLVTRNSKWYDVVPAAMIGSGVENPQQPPSLWVQQSPPPNLPPHNFQRHSSFEDDQHNLTFDLLEKSPSSLLNKDHFRSFLSLLIYTLSISNAWHWTWTAPGGWLWRSTYRSLLKSKLCQITFLDTGIIRAATPYSRMC